MFRATTSLQRSMMPRSINLVLDWDGTITMKDTMFAYGKVADIRDARLHKNPTGSQLFGEFGKAWIKDYSEHEQAYSPKTEDRKTVAQENAWLKSISVVETRSAKRVEKSGFFKGVTRGDIEKTADELLHTGDLSLRQGWKSMFLRAFEDHCSADPTKKIDNISILSVNWSEAFIRASLQVAAQMSRDDELYDGFDQLNIAANEISGMHQVGGSSGRLTEPGHAIIRTSFDKLQNFKTQDGCCNVYVGDSATDFDCLLAADLGICIRDDEMGSSARTLADTLSRVGITVQHVSNIGTWEELSKPNSNVLWARDFHEIMSLLERLKGSDENTRS